MGIRRLGRRYRRREIDEGFEPAMLCPKLCATITAGTVEQDDDGLPGFKISEGAGAFPDPTGVRVGLKDASVDVLNKRTVRCLLIAVRFTRRQQYRRLCRRNIPG